MSLLSRSVNFDYNKIIVLVGAILVSFNVFIHINKQINNSQNNYTHSNIDSSISSNVDNILSDTSIIDTKDQLIDEQKIIEKLENKPIIQHFKNKTKVQIILASGDTLYSSLINSGIEKNTSHLIALATNKVYKLSQLQVGENLLLTIENGEKVRSDIKAKVASILIETNDKKIKVEFNEKKRAYIANLLQASSKEGNAPSQALTNSSQKISQTANKSILQNPQLIQYNKNKQLNVENKETKITEQKNISDSLNSKTVSSNSLSSNISNKNHTSSLGSSNSKSLKPTLIKNNHYIAGGSITGSLIDSIKKSGVPNNIAGEMARVLSYSVDFQRDLSNKSLFKVIYNNENGENKLMYVHLHTNKKIIDIYRHNLADGSFSYFYKDGSGIKKSLLKTPVKGGTIGSGFGIRKHPVLGYSRMHHGLDYRAQRGTPVIAAGDGVVDTITSHRGYGRYVKIKHNNKYNTLYAHLDRFAKDIKVGNKIKQGEVIGFVGNSGMATGHHLHFEVHENGHPINPKKAINFNTDTLSPQQFHDFQSKQNNIHALLQKYESIIIAEINESDKLG